MIFNHTKNIAIIVSIFIVSACNINSLDRESIAVGYVSEFHENMDSGAINEIYEKAHDDFRSSISKNEFNDFLNKILLSLGERQGTRYIGYSPQAELRNPALYGVIFETKFEKGVILEKFVLIFDNQGQHFLYRYDVNSDDLIRALMLKH